MKAQRRHELQENALQSELSHLGEFLRRRGTAIAWVVLGVALVIFLVVYVRRGGAAREQALVARYAAAENALGNPDVETEDVVRQFESLAAQSDDPHIAAMAAVHLGDMYASQAYMGEGDLTAAEQQERLDQAENWYRTAIEEHGDQALPAAQARFGLAKLAESARDFATAREQYDAVVAAPGLAGQLVVQEAQRSLERLGRLSEPVRLATTLPASTTEPATQEAPAGADAAPATQPAE